MSFPLAKILSFAIFLFYPFSVILRVCIVVKTTSLEQLVIWLKILPTVMSECFVGFAILHMFLSLTDAPVLLAASMIFTRQT